jgi:hypothetical protein
VVAYVLELHSSLLMQWTKYHRARQLGVRYRTAQIVDQVDPVRNLVDPPRWTRLPTVTLQNLDGFSSRLAMCGDTLHGFVSLLNCTGETKSLLHPSVQFFLTARGALNSKVVTGKVGCREDVEAVVLR